MAATSPNPAADAQRPTQERLQAVLHHARTWFAAKFADYGPSWAAMRLPSVTDQLYIKAMRIRTLEETGTQQVDEGVAPEYVGLMNYALVALILLERQAQGRSFEDTADLEPQAVLAAYDLHAQATLDLLTRKNHDYGEAWKAMRRPSITDQILVKLRRIQWAEDHGQGGGYRVSEGVASIYADIFNYAGLALLKMAEAGEWSPAQPDQA